MKKKQHPECGLCSDASCATAFLTKPQVQKLTSSSSQGSIRKRDLITLQGTRSDQIIYLRSGLVKEYQQGQAGNNSIIQIIKPFSYIGLHSVFADRVNQYSYAALDDCSVCYIDAKVFKQLVRENGDFANSILGSVCLDSLNSHHRFLNLQQKQTYGKLADTLLYFSDIIYNSKKFELGLSRYEIASLTGISRESATRALHYLSDEGVIDLKGRSISIRDIKRLQRISRIG